MGAALADSVLQAGVSYRTVVSTRIKRIHLYFPEAATLSGLCSVIERRGAADFLSWKHPTKVNRFMSLTQLLTTESVETTFDLRHWLSRESARSLLLHLHGFGPKTFDYLCGLVGLDCIAVDRHIKTFASEAGVAVTDYDGLRTIISYAADLLDMRRRDFDAWVWQLVSARTVGGSQLDVFGESLVY
jgi:hypothetical protein